MLDEYRDTHGEHRWRVVADNGRIVGDSAEGYEHGTDCHNGAVVTLRILLRSLPEAAAEVSEWITGRRFDDD